MEIAMLLRLLSTISKAKKSQIEVEIIRANQKLILTK